MHHQRDISADDRSETVNNATPSLVPCGAFLPAADADLNDDLSVLDGDVAAEQQVLTTPENLHRPSLIVNALSSWVGLGVNIIVGFLLTPFVIAHFGKGGYGIWMLVGSIIGYYGLLDLGISAGVRRYVACFAAQRDITAVNETVSSALAMFSCAGLFMLVASIVIAGPLSVFFNVTPVERPTFQAVVYLLGTAAAVNILGQVFRATIAAYEYFVVRNCIAISATLARAGLTVCVLMRGWGLVGVAVSYLAADILSFLVYLILVKRLTPHVHPRPQLVRWRRMIILMMFGITATLILVSNIVIVNLDSMVIARMINLEAVAVYGVAAVLINYYNNFLHTGMGVLNPRFAGLHGLNDVVRFRGLLINTLWISSVLSCMVGLLLLVLGKQFIALWVGPAFAQAYVILAILTVTYVAGLAQAPSINALYAVNKHKYLAIMRIGEAGCNLVLSIVLASRYGIVGVALGTLMPHLVAVLLIQPVYMARVFGVSWGTYCTPMLAAAVPLITVYLVWRSLAYPYITSMGYGGLCVMGGCIGAVYVGVLVVGLVLFAAIINRGPIEPAVQVWRRWFPNQRPE